jgi:hypothetical protein
MWINMSRVFLYICCISYSNQVYAQIRLPADPAVHQSVHNWRDKPPAANEICQSANNCAKI